MYLLSNTVFSKGSAVALLTIGKGLLSLWQSQTLPKRDHKKFEFNPYSEASYSDELSEPLLDVNEKQV